MTDLTKSEKRAVRELLGEAHEAEIASALGAVETAIREWREGRILPSEVSDRIHTFHKQSQEIFKTYNYVDRMLALARAVVLGFVRIEQVPESLQARVRDAQTLFGGQDEPVDGDAP
ncbi:MAG TPA: hypothetical protein VFP80_04475 [Thermoanaerobaculia bacterium]|nr:hypothetical protein [Thermoanaerobaculia bacterium]